MVSDALLYQSSDTPLGKADPRVKIAGLAVCSAAVLLASAWWHLLVLAVLFVAAAALGQISPARMNRMLVPVYVMAGLSLAFNIASSPNLEGVETGLFVAARMIVLVSMSFAICLSTSVTELLDAFGWFVSPLRRLGAPVDDIACTLALSVRFIPVIEAQFSQILRAQRMRGSGSPPSIARRAANIASAFAALFIGLFRQADCLADAMDARCYGAANRRTRLPK